ncbi:MAG: acetyl-CoA carboxylase biotin carboxyl carrier protein [Solirubrobacterales bacterium]|nr:acetyl-CoA carboxylase biotin carboxyl carrier protein [Solirubrobacterales bacterium]
MPLTDEDVREILRLIDESDVEELHIETEGFALHVSKGGGGGVDSRSPETARGDRESASPPPQDTRRLTEAAGKPPPQQPEADAEPEAEDGLATIEAPMLGTFYRAEGPGQKPFVEIGSRVDPDSTVCIIEVMKMMNSVPAGIAGTIVEVCSENAQMVEFGQPLFKVKPQ